MCSENATPNMALMEDKKVPEPLTVPMSSPSLPLPLITSLRRRQWTDPPSSQQVSALTWKRPLRCNPEFYREKGQAQRKKVASPWS